MSLDPTGPFALNVNITRADVVEWLQQIPAEELPKVVENTLAAGNMVLSLLQASSGEESMQRFFRPVVERMDTLKDTIDSLLTASKKSQRLGEIGETVVAEHLKRAFPGDEFSISAKEDHQADIHAEFSVDGNKKRKALVEVKLYSGDVPSGELEKFRRDLVSTGVRYGLMVSLTSRMMGIAGPLHMEEGDNYVAVYVPNAGMDGFGVLLGATLLKSIILYESRAEAARMIRTGAIEMAWERLNQEISNIVDVSKDVRCLHQNLIKARDAVLKALEETTRNALSAEIRLGTAIKNLQGRLQEELQALPQTGVAQIEASPVEQVEAHIEELRQAKDKRLQLFEAIYDVANKNGATIALADGSWVLLRGEKEIARTGGTATRIDFNVPIEDDGPVSVIPACESTKRGQVILQGTAKNVDLFRERLEHWVKE